MNDVKKAEIIISIDMQLKEAYKMRQELQEQQNKTEQYIHQLKSEQVQLLKELNQSYQEPSVLESKKDTLAFWNEERIVQLLKKSTKAVERAIVALYHLQVEKDEDENKKGQGFSRVDENRGSYWASWILEGNPLTGSHLETARMVSLKYRRQLAKLANQNLA